MALIALAGTLPTPVLADVLRLSTTTAERWARSGTRGTPGGQISGSDDSTGSPTDQRPGLDRAGVLARHDLCRLAWLDRPTAALIRRPGRYQGARSGVLAHVDVKRPGRLRDGGWPFTAATAWPPVKPATGPGSAWTTPTPTNHRHPRPR